MNQGGNHGDDSTGQHYSMTEHTLHMLIRPRETERGRERERETGRWREGWRDGTQRDSEFLRKKMQKMKINRLGDLKKISERLLLTEN